jgi:hypothetical protein
MVMIDTYTRDPNRTLADVQELVRRAMEQGMSPIRWRMGFFMARDLVGMRVPHFRDDRQWRPLVELWNAPVAVVELEDRLQLDAGKAHPTVRGAVVGHVFEIDRRASSI